MGTAFIAKGYSNIMNYIQILFSIFNAPLFATFIIAMFWKRATPVAGFLNGLVWGLTRKEEAEARPDPRDRPWWRSPGLLGGVAIALVVVLNFVFA